MLACNEMYSMRLPAMQPGNSRAVLNLSSVYVLTWREPVASRYLQEPPRWTEIIPERSPASPPCYHARSGGTKNNRQYDSTLSQPRIPMQEPCLAIWTGFQMLRMQRSTHAQEAREELPVAKHKDSNMTLCKQCVASFWVLHSLFPADCWQDGVRRPRTTDSSIGLRHFGMERFSFGQT